MFLFLSSVHFPFFLLVSSFFPLLLSFIFFFPLITTLFFPPLPMSLFPFFIYFIFFNFFPVLFPSLTSYLSLILPFPLICHYSLFSPLITKFLFLSFTHSFFSLFSSFFPLPLSPYPSFRLTFLAIYFSSYTYVPLTLLHLFFSHFFPHFFPSIISISSFSSYSPKILYPLPILLSLIRLTHFHLTHIFPLFLLFLYFYLSIFLSSAIYFLLDLSPIYSPSLVVIFCPFIPLFFLPLTSYVSCLFFSTTLFIFPSFISSSIFIFSYLFSSFFSLT